MNRLNGSIVQCTDSSVLVESAERRSTCTLHVPCPEFSPHVEDCGWICSRTFCVDMGHLDMFIIHGLRNYPVMLNIPNDLLNLLPGLGRKDGRWCAFPSFVASRSDSPVVVRKPEG